MNSTQSVAQAIEAWTHLLGADRVTATPETLAQYGRTTQDTAPQPSCILYPQSTPEVQSIVRTAVQYGVVLYPISRGKNWGYGDACAPTDGAAIVDLSRMNRIREVDPVLGYAIIEPGVSQQQLYDYLTSRELDLWLDCTGAGKDASLVGNTVDRGFGHTRYGDHFQSCCGMEVVLGDGTVVNTGFGHYPESRSDRVYRYGVGPFLDGIFCQSNYGIVTQIGLWLMPRPEAFRFFYIKVTRPENLNKLIERLRPLRMGGLLQSAIHIGNDLRILSGSGRYPWKEANWETPLPDALRGKMRKEAKIGLWNAGGSITGTKAHVKATMKTLKKAVRGVGKIQFVSDFDLALAEWVVPILNKIGLAKRLAENLKALKPNYGLLKGIPTNEPLMGAEWRLRIPPVIDPEDPLDCGCGLLWISPVVPMTGDHAQRILDITAPIFARYGFEQLVTFTLLTERAMVAIMNVSFDKSEEEETARAVECYDALFEAVFKDGYVPYRVSLRGLPKLVVENDPFWETASKIKRALDPNDIIARGRYVPPLEGRPASNKVPGDSNR